MGYRGNAAVKPVRVKPERCQIEGFCSLFEAAYIMGRMLRFPVTVMQISGAVRALKLKEDEVSSTVKVHGTVIPRQQTMIKWSSLEDIKKYLIRK